MVRNSQTARTSAATILPEDLGRTKQLTIRSNKGVIPCPDSPQDLKSIKILLAQADFSVIGCLFKEHSVRNIGTP